MCLSLYFGQTFVNVFIFAKSIVLCVMYTEPIKIRYAGVILYIILFLQQMILYWQLPFDRLKIITSSPRYHFTAEYLEPVFRLSSIGNHSLKPM